MVPIENSTVSSPSPILKDLNSRKVWWGNETLKIEESILMMELLDNPQNKVPAIIVAGTNGKGSVCSMLASILMSSSKRVAQFTSPHLHHFTERLLIQGSPVKEEFLLNAVGKVIQKEVHLKRKLSYFELIIAASFLISAEEKLDWMVVEVGLGGRLDATNVIHKPAASVITSIGLDHTRILGDTEYLIATEKAGILRKDVPAFVGVVSEEAKAAISKVADSLKTSVDYLERTPSVEIKVPQYKANNINLARRVATALGFSDTEIDLGIKNARWPGRLEEISVATEQGEHHVVLDGAHNPDGVTGLTDYLDRRSEPEFIFLISILSTKDSSRMLEILNDWAKNKKVSFIFCKMNHESAVDPKMLSSHVRDSISVGSTTEGLEEFKKRLNKNSLGVVTGSLYFIGDVRGKLVSTPFTTIARG